ncbi:GH36-type glycosyl hydrolase domain-containing protein [Haploplasma axanthum]|uniref:Cellobiose phosphorylase n=1 Tax=Haploplasma axanthum TaxID=29552 RepID=A0A449BFI5_HAPAX|nr:hypothetical protein [Haploplasma axanthum]VEU81204.1 Cellobiose phosphorylase [Haploplasma axanthum]
MIKFNTQISVDRISTDKLNFEILKSGDIYQIYQNDTLINLLKGNLLDGSVSNIYLRRENEGKYEFEKLLGVNSNSEYEIKGNSVIYSGVALDVKYQVTLSIVENRWYYDVLLDKVASSHNYELFYGQDVSVASRGMVQSSEAYTGQYVDYKVFIRDNKHTVLSRQNQGTPNLVQIGSFNETNSFSTDGFQFFGLSYKETNIPESLLKEELENRNYQYEFPYVVIQTKKFKLDSKKNFIFYGLFVENYKEIREEEFEINPSPIVNHEFTKLENAKKITHKIDFGNTIVGLDIQGEELKSKFKNIRNLEEENGKVLSFFADNYKHVITKEKELLVERPHGHILIHGDILNASENVFASTGFISGIFSSHIVLGNTNFHKLSGDVRNMLNVQKIAGLRIYIEVDNKYSLLTLPSYFEINANSLKWVYKLDNDTFEITYDALINDLQQSLEFKSLKGIKYNVLITEPIIMGEVENGRGIDFEVNSKKEITFTAKKNQMVMDRYPDLKYKYISANDVEILDDQEIFGDDASYGMLLLKYRNVSSFKLHLLGTLEKDFKNLKEYDKLKEEELANNFYHSIIPLKIEGNVSNRINAFNDLSFWYVHNALVHYSSPHGLEQFNGAAWGTRDVCQGPFELFITAQKYDLAKRILLKTFERQFIESGDYPQWFMFDKYYYIQAHESHGDIIVWPLKALATYLEVTGDRSILSEKVSYMSLQTNDFTKEKYSIVEHVNKSLDRIRSTEIEGIPLPAYGGGDWDDTLQPANQELTKIMVSTWTVSLLHQAFSKLLEELPSDEKELIDRIKKHDKDLTDNYYKYLIKNEIPTGFTIFDKDEVKALIHPTDNTTGLKYRLLAINRGIISELYDKDKIDFYVDLIDKNLKHPDGVRLMNDAVTYKGGKQTYFMRAETASNFGREVGLQYVHAHIRYIEAMAKIGKNDYVLDALSVINPINIRQNVKNALYRQSNAYFSSSDGYFYDRYEAKKNFDKLRTGEVQVKAGWRVYSSGPGIYLNQLITNALGIKVHNNDLLIDPAVSKEFDNVTVNYKYLGKDLKVKYHHSDKNSVLVNGKEVSTFVNNKYKENGYLIDKQELSNATSITVDVFFK